MLDLIKKLHEAAYWETHIREGVRKNQDIGPENTLYYKAAEAISSLTKPKPVEQPKKIVTVNENKPVTNTK